MARIDEKTYGPQLPRSKWRRSPAMLSHGRSSAHASRRSYCLGAPVALPPCCTDRSASQATDTVPRSFGIARPMGILTNGRRRCVSAYHASRRLSCWQESDIDQTPHAWLNLVEYRDDRLIPPENDTCAWTWESADASPPLSAQHPPPAKGGGAPIWCVRKVQVPRVSRALNGGAIGPCRDAKLLAR